MLWQLQNLPACALAFSDLVGSARSRWIEPMSDGTKWRKIEFELIHFRLSAMTIVGVAPSQFYLENRGKEAYMAANRTTVEAA